MMRNVGSNLQYCARMQFSRGRKAGGTLTMSICFIFLYSDCSTGKAGKERAMRGKKERAMGGKERVLLQPRPKAVKRQGQCPGRGQDRNCGCGHNITDKCRQTAQHAHFAPFVWAWPRALPRRRQGPHRCPPRTRSETIPIVCWPYPTRPGEEPGS